MSGRSDAESAELVLRQIEGAVLATVDFVQIRERDLGGQALAQLVRRALAIVRGSVTRVLVNDRLDVALATGAGAHLRDSSISATDARRIAPRTFLGRSVHSAAGAAGAGPVDYLIAGTVFPTASKSERVQPIGRAGLEKIVRAASETPVLAIGGIDANSVRGLSSAGVRGVAAIGAFLPATERQDIRVAVQASATTLRLAFDSDPIVS